MSMCLFRCFLWLKILGQNWQGASTCGRVSLVCKKEWTIPRYWLSLTINIVVVTSAFSGTGRILSETPLGLVDGRLLQENPGRPVNNALNLSFEWGGVNRKRAPPCLLKWWHCFVQLNCRWSSASASIFQKSWDLPKQAAASSTSLLKMGGAWAEPWENFDLICICKFKQLQTYNWKQRDQGRDDVGGEGKRDGGQNCAGLGQGWEEGGQRGGVQGKQAATDQKRLVLTF